MVEFPLQDLFVTGVDPAILRAQQEVNKALEQMPHANLRTPEGLATLRASTAPPQAAPVRKPTDLTMRGPGGDVRLHVFTPQAPAKAVFLRIHGGGWISGAPEDDDALNDQIARTCGVVVISPEYRLAPEVTIREQIDDCAAVARWVGAEAERRFGATAVLLGGCSAGSHLAAATLLRLRDTRDGIFPRITGALLDCGLYDLSGSPSVRAADDRALILTPDWILSFFELGLPGLTAEARRDPSVSPLYADLAGLPPALFTVGALDPLRDDSLFLAARWQAAGGNSSVDVWPEGAHAFTNMGTPLSALALERTTSWLLGALARAQAQRTWASPSLRQRPSREESETMSTKDNIGVVRRYIDQIVNRGDASAVPEICAEDMIWRGGSLGEYRGLAAIGAFMSANMAGAFTEMHLEVKQLIAEDETVVALFTNSGRHTGPFMGALATGRFAKWLGTGIYLIRNGKIAEATFVEDILDLLRQLGVTTLPGAGPAAGIAPPGG